MKRIEAAIIEIENKLKHSFVPEIELDTKAGH